MCEYLIIEMLLQKPLLCFRQHFPLSLMTDLLQMDQLLLELMLLLALQLLHLLLHRGQRLQILLLRLLLYIPYNLLPLRLIFLLQFDLELVSQLRFYLNE